MREVRRTLCNRDCPDTCSILATVRDGRVVRLAGDPAHPLTRGFLCYRTNQFLGTQYSPERLTQPLLRKGGVLEPVRWEEALDYVAAELLAIRAELGAAAIFHYRSGGSLGLLKGLTDRFFSLFGPVTVKRGDICSGAAEEAQRLDFGISDSGDPEGLERARHILLWGKNPVVSSPHSVPILKRARAAGAEIVLIDPVRSEAAKLADRYVNLAPGGDLALALAVGRRLFELGRVDAATAEYCEGLPGFRALCHRHSIAEWCQQADVEPVIVQDLARRLGGDGPCAIVVGWGMGRRTNGGSIVRALDALCAISGNLGVDGGGCSFYFQRRAAFDAVWSSPQPPPRTICEPLLAEQVHAAKDPPIAALWVTAGNPVAMLPDSARTAEVVRSRRLSVVVDSRLTDTARLATVVLPTTTLLEDDDILGCYGSHYVGVSRPVVAPPRGVASDLEIVQALAKRVGLAEPMAGSARQWKERVLSERARAAGVTLSALEAGAMRNPLVPRVAFADRRFATPSGKAELLTDVPDREPPSSRYPLRLMAISTRHSQSAQWAKGAPDILHVRVHPESAGGVDSGSMALLESEVGQLRVVIDHDPSVRRDLALAPKGGHYHNGTSANALLAARLTDLGEGGALYEQGVGIRPLPT